MDRRGQGVRRAAEQATDSSPSRGLGARGAFGSARNRDGMSILLRRLGLLLLLPAVLSPIARGGDLTLRRPIAPGVTCTSLRRAEGPWEIRVLRIQRQEPLIALDVGLASGNLQGVEPLSGIITREDRADDYVVAATNADFFVMAGHPRAGLTIGPMVRRGEVLTLGRGRLAFYITADGQPGIGDLDCVGSLGLPEGQAKVVGVNQEPPAEGVVLYTDQWGWARSGGCVVVQVAGLPLRTAGAWKGKVKELVPAGRERTANRGEVLLVAGGEAAKSLAKLLPGQEVSLELTTRGLEKPVSLALGGGPLLLRGGQVVPEDDAAAPRHPRTAIGYSEREIVLVTVDGRQPGWSVGMTLPTLAKLMTELGCTEALNLDGGGSTTAWVRGEVANRPSDGGERRIANAVLVRSRGPKGPLARLIASADAVAALSGARVPVQVWLTDDSCNPVDADAALVQAADQPDAEVRPETSVGDASSAGEQITASYGAGGLELRGGPGRATVRLSHPNAPTAFADIAVEIVARLPRLEVIPSAAYLCAGERALLVAEGLADDGRRIWVPEGLLSWRLEGHGVKDLGQGLFEAVEAGGAATVTAVVGEAEGVAQVRVASEAAVEGFEGEPSWVLARYPDTDAVTGEVAVMEDAAGEGKRYCRMSFDLGEPTGTRAAYLRLDRRIGSALRLTLLVRAKATAAPWLRAAVVDGNGTRHLLTFAGAVDWDTEWKRVSLRLPDGVKPPLVWQSVYVVATGGSTSRGHVDLDDLRVARVEEAEVE